MSENRRQIKQIIVVFIVILLVAGSGFAGGVVYDRLVIQPQLAAHSILAPAGASDQFKLMADAWNTIQKNYVDREALKDPSTLSYGAISGMVDALGDTGHSRFMNPDMVRSESSLTTGQFEGIGAEVQMKNNQVVIVAPMDGSPAQKAGLQPGDIIQKVDGTDVTGLPLEAVVSKIVGPAGTTVKLTIQDPNSSKVHDVTITRAKINLVSISWAMVPGTTVADIHINEFSKGVTDQLKKILADAKGQGATALILDLRNNPGGLLDEAVGVTSQFVGSGDALQVRDAKGKVDHIQVEPGGEALDIPLVVLINQGTASAAEIVSGAIQDTGRARLIGETTFGTGTVLNQFPLPGGSALLLATGEWLTPNGRVIWHHGIAPDQEVVLETDVLPLFPTAQKQLSPDNPTAGVKDTQFLAALRELDAVKATAPTP